MIHSDNGPENSGQRTQWLKRWVELVAGMTYRGVHPTTMLADGEYPKGVKLDRKSMIPYEKCLTRLTDLDKGFIKISSSTAAEMLPKMAN